MSTIKFLTFNIALLLFAHTLSDQHGLQHSNKKCILITFLYNETNRKRVNEYTKCLEINRYHPSIEKIHVIYDTSKDMIDNDNRILTYSTLRSIPITYSDKRPTYGFCFEVANRYYPNRRVIVANADIYFNETLTLLEEYDLTNKFLALTRWDVRPDGVLVPFAPGGVPITVSQDVWIFETPLHQFGRDDIELGILGCDTRIAYWAQKSGLTVVNPCLTIQCCHLHNSRVRNYNAYASYVPAYEYSVAVPWTSLETNYAKDN